MSARAMPAAYGLRIEGLPSTPWLSATGVEHWPLLRIERSDKAGAPTIDVERMRARIPSHAEVGELIHPILCGLVAQVAISRGLDGLHAGSLCGAAGVWAIVGPKRAGKSTLLAACATEGLSVFGDDVLFFGDGRCFAGPRCLDLREDAARGHAATERVRSATPRERMTLPPVQAEQPLAGIVHLGWSESLALQRLSVAEALRRLIDAYSSGGFSSDRSRLLDLAGLPSYELRRPRARDQLPETVGLLRRELLLR